MQNLLELYSNNMNIFIKEIRNFSRDNWWLYIIFFICISLIWYTNTGNIFEISVVFFLHFLWDIFMMMMGEYYANWEKRKGSISQILSVIVFTFIGIYAFIFNGKINYLMSQVMFWFTSIKVYFEDMKWVSYKILNYKTSLIIWCLMMWMYWYFNLVHTFAQVLQIIGFIAFSTALILNNEKHKYFWSLMAIFIIMTSSGIETYSSFLQANIKGIDISFTLLPLTVFVFYMKNIKKYL